MNWGDLRNISDDRNIAETLQCHNSWVIRQKGASQDGFFKKTRHDKIYEKQTF